MKPGEPEVLPFQCLAHLGPGSIRKCAGSRRLVLSTYPPPPHPQQYFCVRVAWTQILALPLYELGLRAH